MQSSQPINVCLYFCFCSMKEVKNLNRLIYEFKSNTQQNNHSPKLTSSDAATKTLSSTSAAATMADTMNDLLSSTTSRSNVFENELDKTVRIFCIQPETGMFLAFLRTFHVKQVSIDEYEEGNQSISYTSKIIDC